MFFKKMEACLSHLRDAFLHHRVQVHTNFSSIDVYSGVPNNRGGVRKIGGGGWKWFNITVIRGVGIIGGGGSWRNRK